jgi:hypothetical protein
VTLFERQSSKFYNKELELIEFLAKLDLLAGTRSVYLNYLSLLADFIYSSK